jgi:S-adenosylmethionine-diacylglycerol 3-amino-3-carboxypropyl transferase
MADISSTLTGRRKRHIDDAVFQNAAASKAGLSERLFALLFSGLVYPQIWEDPEIDMQALGLRSGHRVVTIASGGCNILAYLTRSPATIDAVDLNAHHIALNRLKLAAFRTLPAQADVFRFFGETGNRHNTQAYDRFIAPGLDAQTQRYWTRRDWRGRRRIAAFEGNFYRTGLLGAFISTGHLVARMHGVDPRDVMKSETLSDQRRFFDAKLRPLFDRPLVRWMTSKKASLFGLGIPPAQYDELITDGDGTMASVLRQRLEKLCCHFPLRDNYFAWQAFARHYPSSGEAALPLYLEPRHYRTIRDNVGRVSIHHRNLVDLLASKPAASLDRYVLLDAQDWMSDAQLNALWAQIDRTAAPGARVIFRTAARASLLPGRVSPELLDGWRYEDDLSRDLSTRDRSAIYGGFHLYVRKER